MMPLSLPVAIAIPVILTMAVCWVITYVLIIRKGFKDAVVGIPVLAFCMNFAWEFIFSFVYPDPPLKRQINIIWFLADLGILAQIILFGTRNLRSSLMKKLFYPAVLLFFVGCFSALLPVARQLQERGAVYSGFVINSIMSVLFLVMLVQRNSSAGQSMPIALFKLVGTVCAFLPVFKDQLVQFLFSITFVFDVGYALALYIKIRQERAGSVSRPEVLPSQRPVLVPVQEQA